MKVTLNLSDVSDVDMQRLAAAMLDQVLDKGLAVRLPERKVPYSLVEAEKALNVSQPTIRRMVQAGRLRRVSGLSRFLVSAESLHAVRDAEA